MDGKTLFWSGALLNMAVLVALSGAGIRRIRRGEVARHKRRMLTAAALVLLFLVAYALKLVFLGREELATWSRLEVWTLRFHETCVLVMVCAGSVAGHRAWRMRGYRRVTGRSEDPVAPASLRNWHARAGWTAVVAAVLGLLSAALVLGGMYRRVGIF